MAQDTQRKKEKPTEAMKPAATKTMIYVGPNLAGDLRLSQFTVFKGGLPAEIKAVVDADATLARLFVPVDKLAQARVDLAKEASPMQQAAGHVFKKYRLGGNK